MIRTLVILGSSITALALARDARALGVAPVVIDRDAGIAMRSRGVVPVVLGTPRPGELTAVLRHGGASSALVATSDAWLRFVLAARPDLDRAFARVLHPDNRVLEILLDKYRFARWCRDLGLSAPAVWVPGAEPRPPEFAFPLLLRPRKTLHARPDLDLPKAMEVHDEDALQTWLARFARQGGAAVVSPSLLSQPLTQYAVAIASRGDTTLSLVTQKLRPGPGACAQGSLVTCVEHGAIERLARRVAGAIAYRGIGEVEILHAGGSGENHIVEVNARPWLQYALAPASGRDFLGLILDRRHTRRLRRRRRPATWINLRNDRALVFSDPPPSRRARWRGLAAWLLSLTRANVYAVFAARDPAPFVHLALETLVRGARRLARILARRPARARPGAGAHS